MLRSKQSLRHSAPLRLKVPSPALLRRGLLLFINEKELFWLLACRYFVSRQCETERVWRKAMLAGSCYALCCCMHSELEVMDVHVKVGQQNNKLIQCHLLQMPYSEQ